MEKEKEEKIKERYMQLSMMEEQLKKMQSQIEKFDEQLEEISSIKLGLDELKKVNKGANVMVPIQQGIFTRAQITDPSDFMVNVGNNIIVNKNTEETKKLLDDQISELSKARNSMVEQMQKFAEKAESLQKETLTLINA